MDKYEYNLKLEQIKQMYGEEKFEEAAEMADEINWNRVKNVNTLVKIGEIYEKADRCEDARDILLLAYERSPLGRMIIYHLAEIALKMGDLGEAEEYCNEFARIAPHDNLKYVLSYDIEKAKGASYEKLISILEEYKEQDYQEKEAYELAELYSLNGQKDKCVEVCDELILWFGEGSYVEKALELKKKYQPLTKAQEEKYRQITAKKNGFTEIAPETMMMAGEYGHDAVSIPEVNVNDADKFSTVNLQAEIAKGIQKIMETKKQEEGNPAAEDTRPEEETYPNRQIEREQNPEITSEPPKPETLFSMDDDGQISLMTEADQAAEKQITGQMTIQDMLDEWDRSQPETERIMEAEPEKESSETEEPAAEAVPEEKAVAEAAPEEKAAAEAESEEEAAAETESEEEAAPEAKPAEETAEDADLAEETADEMEPSENGVIAGNKIPEEGDKMEENHMKETEDVLPVIADPEDILAEEDRAAAQKAEDELPQLSEEIAQAAAAIEQIVDDETENAEEEESEKEEPESDQIHVALEPEETPVVSQEDAIRAARKDAEEAIAMVAEDTDDEEEIISEPTIPLPDLQEALSAAAAQRAIENEIEKIPLSQKGPLEKLTDDMRYAFAYFVPIRGMEEQILDAINDISMRLTSENAATYGNMIITGEPGCGKTVLATTMIRILQQYCGRPVGKVGKISAKALNNKDIQALTRKVAGGCLIVENAGELSHRSIATMSYLMETDRTGLLIVLEDSAKAMRKLLALDELFARKFTSRISIPIFTPDELVAFARSYSKEQGYKIDDLAILALYQRISNIQKLDQATTLGEVKDIVDAAIKKEAKWSMHKYISILTAKRYTKDDRILLSERDFK